jgi:hypothetical protein
MDDPPIGFLHGSCLTEAGAADAVPPAGSPGGDEMTSLPHATAAFSP